jgi:hypothetical protein
MKLIAHRGLMNGPDQTLENTPDQIDKCLAEGFDVEVDVWWLNGRWWLGHDEPKIATSFYFLKRKGIWIHCKNELVLEKLVAHPRQLHYFWHQTDCYTLTSKGIPWIYPGKQPIYNGVTVLPEEWMDLKDVKLLADNGHGICSDYVADIKEILK